MNFTNSVVSFIRKAFVPASDPRTLSGLGSSRGWFPLIREPFAGAWQHNVEIRFDSVLSNYADFACRTLIASDISKLPLNLVELDQDGIWNVVKNPAYSPVLRKPNHYQNRMQFLESWVLSKLQMGNTYVLKVRDQRNVVTQLYVLDPRRVMPLVSQTGDVFYELHQDDLSGIASQVVVPASEIIHDRFNCMFHPLVGVSPIFASGLAATQGNAIQRNSTHFFLNGSQPGGILVAPGAIDDATAKRLKEHWEENYSGNNQGKVAVLGDGLKYEAMAVKAVDAQLIDQLKWTASIVCSTYHVPPYKIGVGQMPTNNNVEALNTEYYSQCLQVLIEAIELCLDEGLNTGEGLGTELDISNLLRMDTATQLESLEKGVKGGILKPNEARAKLNLSPVAGGDTPYLQQQNFSLFALDKRDSQEDPFATGGNGSSASSEPSNDNLESEGRAALLEMMKGLSNAGL